jgi:hypothetical protein
MDGDGGGEANAAGKRESLPQAARKVAAPRAGEDQEPDVEDGLAEFTGGHSEKLHIMREELARGGNENRKPSA